MELESQPVTPAKAEISFDDFSKMDIRIGKVLTAERVEKSKKLLKLQVDTGIDTRTVMSGIAEHFSPEEMVGKQVTILVNLAPRKIMGVESQGMILMAEDKNGDLKLLAPDKEVSPGSAVS
jgi:methionyl-tRNA synthetase